LKSEKDGVSEGISVLREVMAWAGRNGLARLFVHGADRRRAREESPHHSRRIFSASRPTVLLAIFAIGATLACAAVGYDLAQRGDRRLWSEQHVALRNAIAEFPLLFARAEAIDTRFVRLIEQSARLKGLKFQAVPSAGREMQPAFDAQGRIAGFFTWEKIHPMTRAMNRMLPAIGGVAVLLVCFAGFSLRQLKRAQRQLAASEELARRAADADKLTGLPNHAKTLELLDLALAERSGEDVTSFAMIELDGMADMHAQIGVLGADEFIVAVAERLRAALPDHAICGRIGGDQFAVIFSAAPTADAEAVVRSAVEAVARPHWNGRLVQVSAHAGFAQAPRHAATRGELMRLAGLALRAAAQKGPGAIVDFEPDIDTVSTDRKFIQRELPRALEAGELELHYQPIVSAQGGRIVAVEALLRWTHAVRGSIGPAAFIPVAEQMGLMDTIGAFVLRRALADAKRWPDLYIAVNLSPVQVHDKAIVDLVRAVLDESGVAPSRLMLEITEGVLIDKPYEMLKRIEDLHVLGVRIALDDFGSGYSNLGYLQRFPLDKLKIDKCFVDALGDSGNGGVIIQAIVALGRALGLSVLAEGVETDQQRVLLRLAGCDEMQGFLFARPVPARSIDRLLRQGRHGAAQAVGAA
jgi:diguanylate cyclase (GGDEF)-like protein